MKNEAINRKKLVRNNKFEVYENIDFKIVKKKSLDFAKHIRTHFDEIVENLLEYESFEVAKDEIERTLDILENLEENKLFFQIRIGEVTSFLPRNQPLYALTCFVLVPSLMASGVHFRIPHSMRFFFPRLLGSLKTDKFFPNVYVSTKERLKFLEERSALLVDKKTEESTPKTDVVIFTGTSAHAEKLRTVFDKRTLFIVNGSGHNPIIISEDANLKNAVEAVLKLQLYNQGQDCAAPNAILVHKNIFKPFLLTLKQGLKKIKVGEYPDRKCKVGPISDADDLKRIQEILVNNRQWIDPSTPGIINTTTAIVQPTIICKPLKEGGNYTEVFAPIMFIQEYDSDKHLDLYFQSSHYPRNAMYVTVFGNSEYIKKLPRKKFNNVILHPAETILQDFHLHMKGVERGTQPYGGYGYAASNVSINGIIDCKPTLPQRDIFEKIVLPLISQKRELGLERGKKKVGLIIKKDVKKLLGMKMLNSIDNQVAKYEKSKNYFDALDIIASDSQRYIEFTPEKTYSLLDQMNIGHIAILEPKHLVQIRKLRDFLQRKNFTFEEIQKTLYDLPKKENLSTKENRVEQLTFFKNIYQLLLAQDSGPRLAHFLMDADREKILKLLDV